MASTILYKFRASSTFEALPMPGSAARLFDVKRAIVRAKKLDRSSGGPQLEFDLSLRNAATNEEYEDESMLLPRGTRVEVSRLPAARGHGLLARIARAEAGMSMTTGGGGPPSHSAHSAPAPGAANTGYYTISSRERDEEDEFVDNHEEKELAALMAVTDQAAPSFRGAGLAPTTQAKKTWNPAAGVPTPSGRGGFSGGAAHHKASYNNRPNADPELRELEQKGQAKKRHTGIPRTFLKLSSESGAGGEGDGENAGESEQLQTNTMGFEELVNRAGGQSGSSAGGKRRDLDYALKLTATSIPEHLQCGICHTVVKNSMLLPWDVEGRTACETCIRDGLTQNGYRCPLTGIEGVSPDDLLPNYGLRKAADLFIKGVMEKMDEIEQQQEDEVEPEEALDAAGGQGYEDGKEKGVVLSKRAAALEKKQKKRADDDDLFGGGDDEFGGDVFDVEVDEEVEKPEEEETTLDNAADSELNIKETTKPDTENGSTQNNNIKTNDGGKDAETLNIGAGNVSEKVLLEPTKTNKKSVSDSPSEEPRPFPTTEKDNTSTTVPHRASSSAANHSVNKNRRDTKRPRGPPAGYAMGPAGGATGPRGATAPPPPPPPSRGGYQNYTGGRGSYRGGGRGGRGGRQYSDKTTTHYDQDRGGRGYRGHDNDHRSRQEHVSGEDQPRDGTRNERHESNPNDNTSTKRSRYYNHDHDEGADHGTAHRDAHVSSASHSSHRDRRPRHDDNNNRRNEDFEGRSDGHSRKSNHNRDHHHQDDYQDEAAGDQQRYNHQEQEHQSSYNSRGRGGGFHGRGGGYRGGGRGGRGGYTGRGGGRGGSYGRGRY
uniref:DWNN domain-containing protein n=1 Tax=Attheya septentrionalis TaxID=420275 RepID=A0A7S2UFA6_9STRA|mmetsp:Transcript_23016/g.41539  ORF Transcript_23016/g.41539 Transcript_23016/m.41539 type:complete len:827 (+) Transcript_23016:337-2817(+)